MTTIFNYAGEDFVAPNGDQGTAQARGRLIELVFGQFAAQTLAVGARFRLADRIDAGHRSARQLAEDCEADPTSMHRLLRALAALGLLTEDAPGEFSLTESGAALRTDRPDSMHEAVLMFTDPTMVQAWQRLDFSVHTGNTAFDEVFGTDFFGYLKDRPELSALFNTTMSQGTTLSAAVVPSSYDFGRFGTVADIGGGDGTLLAAILRAHPSLHGILYDTAEGSAQADETLRRAGVADRCTVHTGDFFTSVPGGAELYLMKSIVHDWDDDRAATILGHCRTVIPEHGRVLIIEHVLPETVDGSAASMSYLSDLNMLVNVGGRERTRDEFAALCERSGFRLTEVGTLPPPASFRLIEAEPV